MNRIITIGREFGSGGREVGRRLAEELGIAYYDQEIVTELLKRTNLAEEYVRNVEERHPLPLLPITTARTFGLKVTPKVEPALSVYNQESDIIVEMAKKSDCIIVGRCADHILRDMRPFRLFVYADLEAHIARCRAKGEDAARMSDEDLRQKILTIDKKRARYYRFYTDQNWGERASYDLCINTADINLKRLTGSLAALIQNVYWQ